MPDPDPRAPRPEVSTPAVPITLCVKGSTIRVGERYSGPPSKMYPLLRDLATGDTRVVCELDLNSRRVVAILEGVSRGGTATGGLLTNERDVGAREVSPSHRVVRALDTILAVRVVRAITDTGRRISTEDYPFTGDAE